MPNSVSHGCGKGAVVMSIAHRQERWTRVRTSLNRPTTNVESNCSGQYDIRPMSRLLPVADTKVHDDRTPPAIVRQSPAHRRRSNTHASSAAGDAHDTLGI